MKKLFMLLLILTYQNKKGIAQQLFEYKRPSFSFTIADNWHEFKGKYASPLMYGKFVKVTDGINGGILRVGRDLYTAKIQSIWNLDSNEERLSLEKEAVLKNYTFRRETLNGAKVVKLSFQTNLGLSPEASDYYGLIYKYLLIEDGTEYIISFFLLSPAQDYERDKMEYMEILKMSNISIKAK